MPVPDRVRDDGSGIHTMLILLDSGFRRNDIKTGNMTFYWTIRFGIPKRILDTMHRINIIMVKPL